MMNRDGEGETFGCEQCWPADPDAAWQAKQGLSSEADLIDESHYAVSILACPRCAQRFVFVFTETIDTMGGDDPQCSNLLPVTEGEAAELVRQGAAYALPVPPDTRHQALLARLEAEARRARRGLWQTQQT